MARFVHVGFPAQHGGVTRFTGALTAIRNLNTTQVVLGALAVVGAPVTRAAVGLRTGYAAWSAAREQRRQDEKLWNIALTDARVMADLSRAMSRDAERDVRGYY
jgi:hypothetical protein